MKNDKKKYKLINRIEIYRKEQHLSQEELAKKCYLSRNSISSMERGEYEPTAFNARLICKALGKSFEEVFELRKIDQDFEYYGEIK